MSRSRASGSLWRGAHPLASVGTFNVPSEAEVTNLAGQLSTGFCVEKYVAKFEVAVYYVRVVHSADAAGNLFPESKECRFVDARRRVGNANSMSISAATTVDVVVKVAGSAQLQKNPIAV